MIENISKRDLEKYPRDLVRTLTGMASPAQSRPATLATSISDLVGSGLRMEKNSPLRFCETPSTLLVPLDVLLASRALGVSSFPGGGALIGTDVPAEIEKVLRPRSICVGAGAKVLPGLTGNLTIGAETSATQFSWLHEADTVTANDQSFKGITLAPHWLVGFTSFSKQLEVQSSADLSGFIVDSLGRGIASALDAAALNGSGVFGQPLGITNTAGVNTVNFTGAATWANALSFVYQVAAANGEDSQITFAANPDVRQKWMQIQRFAGVADTLWKDDDTVAGKPAKVTTNLPSGSIVAGDFSNVVFGLFGKGTPILLTVDPYSQALSGNVQVVASIYADTATLRQSVFAVNSGSAIQ